MKNIFLFLQSTCACMWHDFNNMLSVSHFDGIPKIKKSFLRKNVKIPLCDQLLWYSIVSIERPPYPFILLFAGIKINGFVWLVFCQIFTGFLRENWFLGRLRRFSIVGIEWGQDCCLVVFLFWLSKDLRYWNIQQFIKRYLGVQTGT